MERCASIAIGDSELDESVMQERKPFQRHGLDPRRCNISLDANALDRHDADRSRLVDRLLQLRHDGHLNFVIPGSVRGEIEHPNTPAAVKSAILPEVYSLNVGKTGGELTQLAKVAAILRGEAKSDKHKTDAHHLFEAAKYGGGYFVTEDGRILARRKELQMVLGPALRIVTLREFLDEYDFHAGGKDRNPTGTRPE